MIISTKMSNSPPVSSSAVTTASSTTSINSSSSSLEAEKVHQWILELSAPETREAALLELSKKREAVADLASLKTLVLAICGDLQNHIEF